MAESFFDDVDYDELRGRFLSGGCHALALAIAERTHLDLAVVWIAKGRRTQIAHAMVIVPGDDELYLDIGGVRGLPEILEDLQVDPEEEEPAVEEPVDGARIRDLTRGRHAHRRFPAIDPGLAEAADLTALRLLAAVDLPMSPSSGPRP